MEARRVYADWLEEQGSAAMARFVRDQLAFEACADDDPARGDLHRRLIATLAPAAASAFGEGTIVPAVSLHIGDEPREPWLPAFGARAGRISFADGLPTGLDTGGPWGKGHESLLGRWPLRWLEAWGFEQDYAPRLAASGLMDLSLRLSSDRDAQAIAALDGTTVSGLEVDAQGLLEAGEDPGPAHRLLLTADWVRQLRSLSADWDDFGRGYSPLDLESLALREVRWECLVLGTCGARQVAALDAVAGLRELAVVVSEPGALDALAPLVGRLRQLSIAREPYGGLGVPGSVVEQLHDGLERIAVTNLEADDLVEAIIDGHTPNLRHLSLSGAWVARPETIRRLMASPLMRQLVTLKLSGVPLPPGALAALEAPLLRQLSFGIWELFGDVPNPHQAAFEETRSYIRDAAMAHAPRLTRLTINGLYSLGPEDLEPLLQSPFEGLTCLEARIDEPAAFLAKATKRWGALLHSVWDGDATVAIDPDWAAEQRLPPT